MHLTDRPDTFPVPGALRNQAPRPPLSPADVSPPAGERWAAVSAAENDHAARGLGSPARTRART